MDWGWLSGAETFPKGVKEKWIIFLQRSGEFLSCFSTHQLTYLTLSIFLTLKAFPSCQILDLVALLKKKKIATLSCHTSYRKTRPNMRFQLGSKDGILFRLVVNEHTRKCFVLESPCGDAAIQFPWWTWLKSDENNGKDLFRSAPVIWEKVVYVQAL